MAIRAQERRRLGREAIANEASAGDCRHRTELLDRAGGRTDPSAGASSASIHIELPGRALVSVEAGVDPALVRAVLGSLLR